MKHRIEFASFTDGRCLCACGVMVEAPREPQFDRNEALAEAFREHRRAVGALTNTEIGWSREGVPRAFRVRL